MNDKTYTHAKNLTAFEQVLEFHTKFKQPLTEGEPSLERIEDRIHLRMNLIAEEFGELVEAVYGEASADTFNEAWQRIQKFDQKNRDLIETVDALGDLIYVINGFALEAGVNLDQVVTHIHESNMSKLDESGEAIISDGVTPYVGDGEIKPKGKILKGPNFWEPNIKSVIFSQETT